MVYLNLRMNNFLLGNKKTILLLGLIVILVIGIAWVISFRPQKPLTSPKLTQQEIQNKISPSETLIEYNDAAGFAFSYPDNLSIVKNELEDNITFADLQLSSKDISGSLNLKITESKLTSLDEWLKSNKITQTPKEVKLGSLKATEVKLNDRLILASLDQGVLFSIEMPLIEEDFWLKVYEDILTNFSFTAPESVASQANTALTNDVSFEGEEVIE